MLYLSENPPAKNLEQFKIPKEYHAKLNSAHRETKKTFLISPKF
jgi:hypothetical protein